MFDAGSSDDFSPAKYLKETYSLNRIDWLIISHPDRDHVSDLPNVYPSLHPRVRSKNPTIPTRLIYPSGTDNLTEPLKTYKIMDEKYKPPIADDLKNPPAANWGGVLVEHFYVKPEQLEGCPDDHMKNNLSLVSVVKYEDFEIVFPGDMEPLGWDAVLLHTKIASSVGIGQIRILVAPHHGRKSGIRTEDGKIYDTFLKAMKPHLVLISDKWGNESTDPDAYRPHCLRHEVYCITDKALHPADVITTKTNNFVIIQYFQGAPVVLVP